MFQPFSTVLFSRMFPFKEGLYYIHCFSLVSTHSTIPASILFVLYKLSMNYFAKVRIIFQKIKRFCKKFFIFFSRSDRNRTCDTKSPFAYYYLKIQLAVCNHYQQVTICCFTFALPTELHSDIILSKNWCKVTKNILNKQIFLAL